MSHPMSAMRSGEDQGAHSLSPEAHYKNYKRHSHNITIYLHSWDDPRQQFDI